MGLISPSELIDKWREKTIECRWKDNWADPVRVRNPVKKTISRIIIEQNFTLWYAIFCGILIGTVAGTKNNERQQPPRFITQPSSAGNIVSEGSTKILQCHALGSPQPQYRWVKDGSYLGDFTRDRFYKIQSIKREDAGLYQCIAQNEVGAIYSEKIDIHVAYMDEFEAREEKTVMVRSGGAAILELPPISSYPKPSVYWQSRDILNLYGSKYAVTKDFRQIILDVNGADQKSYRANATNTHLALDTQSPYINLMVTNQDGYGRRQIAPEIIVPPQDAQISKGQAEHELQCIANARPLVDLETVWMKDGVFIETAGISSTFNDLWNRTLSLLNIDSTHAGVYTCHVRLKSSSYPTQTATAHISVLEKPFFEVPMLSERIGEFGKEIMLECKLGGIPYPNVTWYKDTDKINGKALPGFEVDKTTGTLTIHYLRARDSGVYQCWASNPAGDITGYTWLKVKTSAPVMTKKPENKTALEGNDVTLFCECDGSPNPNVTWYRNETEGVISQGRFQILETGSLLIADVRAGDSGQYTCIRSNVAGTVIDSAHVTILVRTQIIQPPADTQVILGHVATLQCRVSSDPALRYNIQWEHNNEEIIPGISSRIIVHLNGTLEIREVRASDVGGYKCIVKSEGGHDERVAHLKIIELPYSPSNVRAVKLPKLAPGANSKAVNITWASGFDGNSAISKFIIQKRTVNPDAGLQLDVPGGWETIRTNISSDGRYTIIEGLTPAASYQFRVSAVNSVGEGQPSSPSNIVTLPQEPPSGSPVGLVGSARSPSQIIIQWHPPLDEHKNGQILGYVIRYRLNGYGDSPWSSRNISNEAQRNYLIQELITWKDYEIQIAAFNNKGIGIYSRSIKVKTREGVPTAPPTKVKAKAVNSTCIKVMWKPPDPQQINGINQGYKIQAWQHGIEMMSASMPPSPFDPLARQTGYICHLDKFVTYNITVLCFTNPGDGKRSESIPVKTLEDVPDEVDSLHFEEISDRAVKVVWTPPKKKNGILIGYSIRYGIKDIPSSFKSINVSEKSGSFKVTELKASTYYSFEVCGITQVGKGKCKSASMKSGVEPVLPNPPVNLAVSNIQPFSVVLQFTPGFDGNSSITSWTVEAQTSRNSSWHSIYEYFEEPESSHINAIQVSDVYTTSASAALSNMESIVVLNMLPYLQYKLRLVANNVVGPSLPSEPTQLFQTLQAPPAHPPSNVTVRTMSSNHLKVRWIPLQNTEWYGNPRGYTIYYRKSGMNHSWHQQQVENPTGNSFILNELDEFSSYDVRMSSFNDVGKSELSKVVSEKTRESVPGAGPEIKEANATSSTTIVVKWKEVPQQHRNGIIDGYKVYYGAKNVPFKFKRINSNGTFMTTLTQLRKFTLYHIQVLAYTRIGDGALSDPPAKVQTWDDVPGAPCNVSFPDVSATTARMIWDAPDEPNGVILAYKIMYTLDGFSTAALEMEFPPETRTFRAISLERDRYYWFAITAQTRLGWGETAKLLVYTTSNRELPQPPSAPRVSPSQVQDDQITFSWTPGRDGFAPIRYYTVEFKEGGTHWQRMNERVAPGGTSYTAENLKPYTSYSFRIQATNDIGPSGFSPPANVTWTLPAAPSEGVSEIQVVPITPTQVKVNWKPLDSTKWNGDAETGGYRVEYQQVVDYPVASVSSVPKEEVKGTQASSVILSDLTRGKNYEIVVVPFNSRGDGEASRPVTVYVGEAVPTGAPRDVEVSSLSSTEVQIEWKAPLQNEQNGDLLGYKIYYQSKGSEEEELEVVPAWCTSHSLFFLEMYTMYSIRMAAFNPAGDGPFSPSLVIKTKQGAPGPVSNISFHDITMTSLKLTWFKPEKQNGEISHYLVTYETVLEAGSGTSGEDRIISKQVRQKVSCCSLLVENLEEETSYSFSVRAKNSVLNELGPAKWKNVTTGPQFGSPKSIQDLVLVKMFSSVLFKWRNDAKSKIDGYYIEAKKRVLHEWEMYDSRWQTVFKTENGPITEFTLSYQYLLPMAGYNFRIIAYNKYGISYPVVSDETVFTPSKTVLQYELFQQRPFYRQTWFLVVIASASVVVIISLVAYLCVKTKSYKYKHESERSLAETNSIEDGVIYGSSVELRQSQKRTGTLRRKGQNSAKAPPRPTPGSVTYTDDESDKAYDNNPDESSLTEKPSEISSTDSQGSETEVEDEVDGSVGHHSFVNHYANVNDTLKQSWQKQRPVRNPPSVVGPSGTLRPQTATPSQLPNNYSSYTDSEPEATASLSGQGRIVLNNMARSRAPLPGFSSFI